MQRPAFAGALVLAGLWLACPAPAKALEWQSVAVATLVDDDLARHRENDGFLQGLSIRELRFSENGYDWNLIQFVNIENSDGPLWVVPHDDENAAFESMIAAVKLYGGVGVTVNSGSGSARLQTGYGPCGGRAAILTACDPNRNFSDATPLFTRAFLSLRPQNQPIIALHTNAPGYGKGKGEITIVDAKQAAKGVTKPRRDGYFGVKSGTVLEDSDVYAIIPYRAAAGISVADVACRTALNNAGVNVWHERVTRSDGSLSNYIVLQQPQYAYVNMEAKKASDVSVATAAHAMMIDAYVNQCRLSH